MGENVWLFCGMAIVLSDGVTRVCGEGISLSDEELCQLHAEVGGEETARDVDDGVGECGHEVAELEEAERLDGEGGEGRQAAAEAYHEEEAERGGDVGAHSREDDEGDADAETADDVGGECGIGEHVAVGACEEHDAKACRAAEGAACHDVEEVRE